MKFNYGLKEDMSTEELKEWFKSFISKEIENRLKVGQGSTDNFTLIKDENKDITLELYSSNLVSDETKVRFTIDIVEGEHLDKELPIDKWFSKKSNLDGKTLEIFVETYLKGKDLVEKRINKVYGLEFLKELNFNLSDSQKPQFHVFIEAFKSGGDHDKIKHRTEEFISRSNKANLDNATRFAYKFIAEHRVDDGGEHILSKNALDLSDTHLKETFKDCAIPLKPFLYGLCRSIINEKLKDYKIEE